MTDKHNDLYLADLFAGGGGFSSGIAQACTELGKRPDLVAINHWDIAVQTHRRNHPWARHLCTGLHTVNPTDVAPHRLNLLAASPECTHHSNARGGKPMNDQSRSSAWLILKWLQELYVEGVLIENVQEFENWGPLGADGRPLKRMRGALFDQFISSLKALGYNVEWRVLNAADYGGATTRERLFIMARRGRNNRIIWPDKSHAQLGDIQPELFNQRARWRPAREIIDWGMQSQSIFTRKRPLAPATLERIAAGLRKFGGKNAEPFLVVLRNHMNAQSINEPVPTLTASGTHVGLCQPFIVPQFGESLPRSVERPLGTITTTSRGIGLCQPFVLSMEHGGKFIVPVNHGRADRRVFSVDNPMPTITTVDAWGVVEPFIAEMSTGKTANSLDEPLSTVRTKGAHHALVEPFIMSYYGNGCISSIEHPLPTCTTKDRFGLVQFGDGLYLDIHFRMLQWRELSSAMGFPDDYEFCGTRDQKVKQIGNAVEVCTARALALSALSS